MCSIAVAMAGFGCGPVTYVSDVTRRATDAVEAARAAQAKADADRKAQEQAAREAQARADAERKAQQEKAAREAQAQADAERRAQEQAAREAQARADAQRKAQEDAARRAAEEQRAAEAKLAEQQRREAEAARQREAAAAAALAEEQLARLTLQGDERVLDVGCGDGKVTAEVAARVPRGSVLGVDPSRDMIAFASSHGLKLYPSVCMSLSERTPG